MKNKLKELHEAATKGPYATYNEPISNQYDAKAALVELVEGTRQISASLPMIVGGNGMCVATTGCGTTSIQNAALIEYLLSRTTDFIALIAATRDSIDYVKNTRARQALIAALKHFGE